MSEDSDDDAGGESLEEINYRRKYQMLLERCEVLQQDNERLINRIQHVYNYTSQIQKEKIFLLNRLSLHNDNWRNNLSQYMFSTLFPYNSDMAKSNKSQEPFRRPSTAKKSRIKEKERSTSSKKISKDHRRSTGDRIKIEMDPDSSLF